MGAAAGGEARKVVTVVFSDHAGSTSLGERLDPESLAREAVDLAACTDHLEEHADALMTLAEVLRRAGRAAEATPALREALRLYEQKGQHGPGAPGAGGAGEAVMSGPCAQRSPRKNSRTSPTSRSGASMAAKWPPRSNSDQWTMLLARSA